MERWLDLAAAVDLIRRLSPCSIGEASTRLIEAGESGVVRARWRLHFSGTMPQLSRHDWRDASLDIPNDLVIRADGQRMATVEVSADDLHGHLGGAKIKRSTKALKPIDVARKAIAAIYPDGIPEIRNKDICRAVTAWLKIKMPEMSDISDDTIWRAAGRKRLRQIQQSSLPNLPSMPRAKL